MTDQIMCAAIPTAAKHGWRTDTGCASTANTTIDYGGETWHVCQIHRAKWERALALDTQDSLAVMWGWR